MVKWVIFSITLFLGLATCKKVKAGHSGQKKQFVNFGDNEGYGNSISRNRFGSFDMFGGGGGDNEDEGGMQIGDGGGGLQMGGGGLQMGGGGLQMGGGGGMQLNENNMGGLALQGNGMDSLGSLIGGSSQFGGMGGFIGAGTDGENEGSMFDAQSDQSVNSLGGFGQSSIGRGESMFSSMDGGNDDNEDILSPFDANSLEGKLEHSINLGDNVNTPGIGQFDMSSFDDMSGKVGEKISSALQSENVNNIKQHKEHKQGDDRQGIGNGEIQDMLSNELGELDTSDEKLQKMLESGLNGQSGFSSATGNADSGASSDMSGLSALLNPQGQMDTMDNQPTNNQDQLDLQNIFGFSQQQSQQTQQQNAALNQLSSTMTSGGEVGDYTPITIHAHASDKPGSDNKDAPPPEESRQAAQQVQETAVKNHREKLRHLKSRLHLLRQKLKTLEEEQSKKSTSNKNNDPKTARNDAIKKLLIKNLKLAAMIASKEIELEEAKGKGLAYLSGKKEDTEVIANSAHSVQPLSKFKPLTELSKKAEEEVNHLSRNPDADKRTNTTVTISTANNNNNNNIIQNNHANHINNNNNKNNNDNVSTEGSNTFLRRINETLQVLDKTSPEVHARSTLTESSKKFLNKLEKQIQSMSQPQAQVMEEKALSTLYKAIKSKAVKAAKRRFMLKQRLKSRIHATSKS